MPLDNAARNRPTLDAFKAGKRLMRLAAALSLATAVLGGRPAEAADQLKIYAAGSLGQVMQQIIAASGLPQRNVATPVLGPAGLLRKRLQSGESTDLFVSTDVAQPRAVATDDGGLVVPFARNRMCLVGWDRLGLTRDNALDKMLSPDLRLATSTPGADPGGDYARAVFARAEAVHPGAQAALTEKALTLVGGPGSAQPQPSYAPAAAIFADNRADLFLYYCTGAAVVMSQVPGLSAVPMPDDLEVYPVYWLAVLSDRPEAERLALFMVSEHGQAILSHNGLLPLVER